MLFVLNIRVERVFPYFEVHILKLFHEIGADAATAVSDFLADILDKYTNAAQHDQLSPVTAEKSATRCG